ncbi:unnamed protein product [Lepidochelys kempii]
MHISLATPGMELRSACFCFNAGRISMSCYQYRAYDTQGFSETPPGRSHLDLSWLPDRLQGSTVLGIRELGRPRKLQDQPHPPASPWPGICHCYDDAPVTGSSCSGVRQAALEKAP